MGVQVKLRPVKKCFGGDLLHEEICQVSGPPSFTFKVWLDAKLLFICMFIFMVVAMFDLSV